MYTAAIVIAGAAVLGLGLRRMLKRRARSAASEPSAVPQAPADAAHAAQEIAPETLAKIEKQITLMYGEQARIRSVKRLETPDARDNPWGRQGRVQTHGSHEITKRPR